MLKGLFGPRTFLEVGLEEWCLEAWAWIARDLGENSGVPRGPLGLANTTFFPATTTEGEARAAYLFERVKDLMGMSDWACELQPRKRPPPGARVGEFWVLNSNAPHGTFQRVDGRAVISYAVDLIQDPRHLIAVFAHELAHFRLAAFAEYAPGGLAVHELLTELAVAYFGFGVFAANAAFSFSQHGDTFSQGWRSQHSGYFSERTWAFALALFLALRGEQGAAKSVLKPSVATMTQKAELYFERRPNLVSSLCMIS